MRPALRIFRHCLPFFLNHSHISLLQRAGIDVVVSALTVAENEELGLVEESRCWQSRAIEFLSFPIEDRSVPNSSAEFTELVNSVTDFLRKGKAVAVHCRAGIGRSSMIVHPISRCDRKLHFALRAR
jgi:protein-tyrosine phosphatase